MKQLPKSLACAFAIFLFTTGCSTFFKRTPAETATLPKHYIMTLHGVRGNEKSYGQLHELLKTHLQQIDPSYEVIPLNFTYPNAQIDFTPHKAAKQINDQLDQKISVLNPKDKISVIAYSMGGQVGVAWYFDSLKDPAHSKYPKQTSNFISLGAAFWGAEEAALLTNDANGAVKSVMKNLILELNADSQKLAGTYVGETAKNSLAKTQNFINTNLIFKQIDKMNSLSDVKNFYDNKALFRHSTLKDLAKISFAELQSLAIVGNSETDLRSAMISKLDEKGVPFKTSTKWTSISTLVPCLKSDIGSSKTGCVDFQNKIFADVNGTFAKFAFGFKRRETDNAVITPSSVAQFYYAYDSNPNYSPNQLTPRSNFFYSIDPSLHKVIFAETLHATLVTEDNYDRAFNVLGRFGKSWEGLADDVVIVHAEKCATAEKCDHPVYKYELEALADCDEPGSQCADTSLIKQFQRRNSSEPTVSEAQSILKSELHGFTMELNLRVPLDFDLKDINTGNVFDYIKMNFDKNAPEADRLLYAEAGSPYKIQVGRKYEMASILINKITYADQQHLKINFTGIISPNNVNYNAADLQNGVPLNFSIALPGLKPRQVEAVVSPYHSTYIDLKMAK